MSQDCGLSYPEEAVEISGFVTMGLNFDTTTKDLNELLPFQLFREVTKALPLPSQGFFAIRVLGLLDLPSLIVPTTLSERERKHWRKRQTLGGQPK